jgi:hypothetical protein
MATVGPHHEGYALEANLDLQALLKSKQYRFIASGHSYEQCNLLILVEQSLSEQTQSNRLRVAIAPLPVQSRQTIRLDII